MAEPRRMAVVNDDGDVVNVILVDPGDPIEPDEGHRFVDDDGTARVHGRWINRKFVDPPVLDVPEVVPEPAAEDVIAAMADLLGVDPVALEAKARERMVERETPDVPVPPVR